MPQLRLLRLRTPRPAALPVQRPVHRSREGGARLRGRGDAHTGRGDRRAVHASAVVLRRSPAGGDHRPADAGEPRPVQRRVRDRLGGLQRRNGLRPARPAGSCAVTCCARDLTSKFRASCRPSSPRASSTDISCPALIHDRAGAVLRQAFGARPNRSAVVAVSLVCADAIGGHEMSKIRWLLATLVVALAGLVPVLVSTSAASADPGTILKFDVMAPVTGPYVGTANLRGTNPVPDFEAIVSCQSISGGMATVTNVTTGQFPASMRGNADIRARVTLPRPCIAPIVFVASPTGAWFAATGS